MKKTKRMAVIVALVLLVVVVVPSPMHAESFVTSGLSAQAESWYYPVLPGDAEWDTMTIEEKRAMCNMPEELLEVCSTERLLELALDNPFLSNFVSIYNETSYAIDHYCRMFNIFDELFTRENLYEILVAEFRDMPIGANSDDVITAEKNLSAMLVNDDYIKLRFLEKTIGVRYYSMSVELQSEMLSIVIEKVQKEGYYPYGITTVMEREVGEVPIELMRIATEVRDGTIHAPSTGETYVAANYDSRFVPNNSNATSVVIRSWGTWAAAGFKGRFKLRPTSGATEVCDAWSNNDFSTYAQTTEDSQFTIENAGLYIEQIEAASLRYNCHSYAWISSSNTNKYWINSLSSWTTDATIVSYNSFASVGDTVVLMSGNTVVHSAIVTSVGSNANTIIAKAKMGVRGVFLCTLADMMTIYGATSYYVYSV